jgi:hypothetical protein
MEPIGEWNVGSPFGPGGIPLPKTGSMDGNTGRSEGATAEKAVPFPCAVRDPNRSFVEVRAGEPQPGARSARFFARTSIQTPRALRARKKPAGAFLHSRRQVLANARIAASRVEV